MKKFDFKKTGLILAAGLVVIAFFSLDFIPSNKKEFERICWNMWSTDTKQYDTCMSPYFRQTNLDKYAIGLTAVATVASAFYFSGKKNK